MVLPPIQLGSTNVTMPQDGRIIALQTSVSAGGSDVHLVRNGVVLLAFGAQSTSDMAYCWSGLNVQLLAGDLIACTGGTIGLIFG